MARFNWQRLAPDTPVERLVAAVNEGMLALRSFLQGLRRDGTTLVVEKGAVEVEEAGSGVILRTPNGSARYQITVSNAGAITSTLLP
jgi:hypothetical protein